MDITGQRPARTWFLEIAFVREAGMCVCVCVYVCVCVRGATIHDLGVSIYCYSDILYNIVKCELADFYR